MKKSKYDCVVLVARNHGLDTLRYLVKNEQNYNIVGIFTHRFNPKLYDPQKNERVDFKDYFEFAKLHNIPITSVDKKNELTKLENFCKEQSYNFLLSISWRYLIPPSIFKKSKIGAINIHRGDLPKYAGIEPIKQALINNEKEIFISSHLINEEFDKGKIISKISHPVNFNSKMTLDENIERLKVEISKYFPILTIKSFTTLINNHE